MANRAELLRVINANLGFELSGTGIDYSGVTEKLAVAETTALQKIYDAKGWSLIAFKLVQESQ